MKTIRVVAAVIRDGEKIFATMRGYGDFKGLWEFPGRKNRVRRNTAGGLKKRNPGRTGLRDFGWRVD